MALDNFTDEELSEELHRRRKVKQDVRDESFQKFAAILCTVLDEFTKLTGKKIVKFGYGYRVEETK